MRRETRQFLYDLEAVAWFHAVGTDIANEPVIRVHSWAEAIEACSAEEWQENRVEQANGIRLQLSDENMHRWNPTMRALGEDVDELVDLKTRQVRERVPDLNQLIICAQWDLAHACIESEFSEEVRTRFYRDVANWYLRGHFACGWSAEGPQPKHIIY